MKIKVNNKIYNCRFFDQSKRQLNIDIGGRNATGHNWVNLPTHKGVKFKSLGNTYELIEDLS